MSMVPNPRDAEKKVRELADQEGPGWEVIEAEEIAHLEAGTKQYWLERAEEALKAERRNAL